MSESFSHRDPVSDKSVYQKFPGKLWKLINSCKTGSIRWGYQGQTIIINTVQFRKQYLDTPNVIFKTSNMSSFIRQLNLYGFRKMTINRNIRPFDFVSLDEAFSFNNERHHRAVNRDYSWSEMFYEFQNEHFIGGRKDLLENIRRNVGARRVKLVLRPNMGVTSSSIRSDGVMNEYYTESMVNHTVNVQTYPSGPDDKKSHYPGNNWQGSAYNATHQPLQYAYVQNHPVGSRILGPIRPVRETIGEPIVFSARHRDPKPLRTLLLPKENITTSGKPMKDASKLIPSLNEKENKNKIRPLVSTSGQINTDNTMKINYNLKVQNYVNQNSRYYMDDLKREDGGAAASYGKQQLKTDLKHTFSEEKVDGLSILCQTATSGFRRSSMVGLKTEGNEMQFPGLVSSDCISSDPGMAVEGHVCDNTPMSKKTNQESGSDLVLPNTDLKTDKCLIQNGSSSNTNENCSDEHKFNSSSSGVSVNRSDFLPRRQADLFPVPQRLFLNTAMLSDQIKNKSSDRRSLNDPLPQFPPLPRLHLRPDCQKNSTDGIRQRIGLGSHGHLPQLKKIHTTSDRQETPCKPSSPLVMEGEEETAAYQKMAQVSPAPKTDEEVPKYGVPVVNVSDGSPMILSQHDFSKLVQAIENVLRTNPAAWVTFLETSGLHNSELANTSIRVLENLKIIDFSEVGIQKCQISER